MSKTKPKAGGNGPRKHKPRAQVRYTEELANRICEKLAQGKTLTSICKGAGMPSEAAVRKWAMDGGEFADKYARAREIGYHKMADDILNIADHPDERTVNRDRLRIDTRKWLLSKASSFYPCATSPHVVVPFRPAARWEKSTFRALRKREGERIDNIVVSPCRETE
jgi:hypothetical protein